MSDASSELRGEGMPEETTGPLRVDRIAICWTMHDGCLVFSLGPYSFQFTPSNAIDIGRVLQQAGEIGVNLRSSPLLPPDTPE